METIKDINVKHTIMVEKDKEDRLVIKSELDYIPKEVVDELLNMTYKQAMNDFSNRIANENVDEFISNIGNDYISKLRMYKVLSILFAAIIVLIAIALKLKGVL